MTELKNSTENFNSREDRRSVVKRLVIKPIRSYFEIMLYGFSKDWNDLDFLVSEIMALPFALVFFAIPLWLVFDAL